MMKILFYVEPLTERERPAWKKSWINFVEQAITSIRKDQPSTEFYCVVGDGLEVIASNQLKDCKIVCINHCELVPKFGSNALAVATNWYRGASLDQLERMGNLVKSRISPFIPDICITFSSAQYIQSAFPNLPILYFEHGLFSRNPFPVTAYLDPIGMYKNSHLYINEKKNRNYLPKKSDRRVLSVVRETYLPYISAANPFAEILKKRLEGYRAVVLVALQFSQFYAYDAHAFFADQYDLLVQTLASVSSDVAVIAAEHPEHHLLSKETLDYLGNKYSNLVWMEEFRAYSSASQYLIEFSDVVVTVSSSVGLQSLLWKKKLIILGDSHLNLIADAHDFENLNTLLDSPWPEYKENFLAWNLTRYTIPFEFLFHKGIFLEKINKVIECARLGNYDKFFDEPFADTDEIQCFYSRHGEIATLN